MWKGFDDEGGTGRFRANHPANLAYECPTFLARLFAIICLADLSARFAPRGSANVIIVHKSPRDGFGGKGAS